MSSDSSSSPGSAAQFTVRNCLFARGDALWIERPTASLPTPLSPRSSTVVLVAATLATRSRIGCILLLVQRFRPSLIPSSRVERFPIPSVLLLQEIAVDVPSFCH